MKKLFTTITLTLATVLTYAGGVPTSPGKLVQTIKLDQSMGHKILMSIAHFSGSGVSEIYAINKNLEDNTEQYRKEIEAVTKNVFSSTPVLTPFNQISHIEGFLTSISLTRLANENFIDAVITHLFSLNLPVKFRMKSVINETTRIMKNFRLNASSVNDLADIFKQGRALEVTSNSSILVYKKNNECYARLSVSFEIANGIKSLSKLSVGIDNKGIELPATCN